MSSRMTQILSRAVVDSKILLAATAIASGALVACTILGYQHFQQNEDKPSRHETASLAPNLLTPLEKEDARNQALAARAQAGDYDEDLILEQLARNRVFLTPTGLTKLRQSFIIVVGCGGVGSHCVTALARSGVEKIRLVDFDQVTLSSLNRHAVATLADVGTPKVACLQRRIAAITPWVRFDLRNKKFDAQSADELLEPWRAQKERVGEVGKRQKPDYVVDAIDNIDTKVALLKYCHDRGIPVISSMGAGCKSDPTRIHVGDIGTSTDDGLSRATRRRLKVLGITHGIPVVYSQERGGEGKAELLPLPEDEFQKGSVGDLGVLPDFRVRILPVLGTMPAVFGYTAANHVILCISCYPTDYRPAKSRDKLYDSVHGFLQGSEERLARYLNPQDPNIHIGLKTPITVGDVALLVEEVFRGRSAVSGVPTRLVLVRWRKPQTTLHKQSSDGNGRKDSQVFGSVMRIDEQKSSTVCLADLVCMTRDEAVRHEREVVLGNKIPEDLYGVEVITRVQKALDEARGLERYRLT